MTLIYKKVGEDFSSPTLHESVKVSADGLKF